MFIRTKLIFKSISLVKMKNYLLIFSKNMEKSLNYREYL